MKTTLKFTLLACLLIVSSACRAQKAVPDISQAFDSFVQNLLQEDVVTSSSSNTYNVGYMKAYEFIMPEKKKKIVDAFHKALLANSQLSYSSYIKKAGAVSNETNRVGYGADNAQTYEFGAHKDRNYNIQYFRDAKDSTKRYVYALVWYPAKDEMIMGSVYKFYSLDPQIQRAKKSQESKEHVYVDRNGNAYINRTVILPDGTVRQYNIEEKKGDPQIDSLLVSGNVTTYRRDLLRNYSPDFTVPKDAAEFMVQLNTLRAAFKNAKEQYPYFGNQVTRRTLQTGVVNKIVKLCKEYGKLLNLDEKKFCATALVKMKKDTDDDYLQSVLELTAKNVIK